MEGISYFKERNFVKSFNRELNFFWMDPWYQEIFYLFYTNIVLYFHYVLNFLFIFSLELTAILKETQNILKETQEI